MEQNLIIGHTIIRIDECGSTQEEMKRMIMEGEKPEGMWVVSAEQKSGKGQQASSWISEPGLNLLATLLLKPKFLSAEKQFFLNMAISLAVRECCEEISGLEGKIKWPNDIFINGKKTAGILIENNFSGSVWNYSFVGIGINVNQVKFENLPLATSLKSETQKEYSIDEVLQSLSHFIQKYYLQLRKAHYNFMEQAYTLSLYNYQHTATYSKNGQLFEGEIVGVDKSGRLLIQSNGKELRFMNKEIEYIL